MTIVAIFLPRRDLVEISDTDDYQALLGHLAPYAMTDTEVIVMGAGIAGGIAGSGTATELQG